MTKICQVEGCNEEISDWQTYCPRHYAEMLEKRKQSNIQQPKEIEQPKKENVQEPKQPVLDEKQQETVQEEIVDDKTSKGEKFQMEKLEGRERLIVKQTAVKRAVDFLQDSGLEFDDYESMINQLRRLTVDIYKIIVEHNEGA